MGRNLALNFAGQHFAGQRATLEEPVGEGTGIVETTPRALTAHAHGAREHNTEGSKQ